MATIKVNGDEITIFDRISTRDKLDIIQISADAAKESEGLYNPYTLDVYFHTYLIMLYTDIEFNEEDRSDIFGTYDRLEKDGIVEAVIAEINEKDYNSLMDFTEDYVQQRKQKELSFAGTVDNFIQVMPEKAKEVADIFNGITPEAVQNAQQLLEDMQKLGNK